MKSITEQTGHFTGTTHTETAGVSVLLGPRASRLPNNTTGLVIKQSTPSNHPSRSDTTIHNSSFITHNSKVTHKRDLRYYGFLDPALGKSTTRDGDYAAIVTVAKAPDGKRKMDVDGKAVVKVTYTAPQDGSYQTSQLRYDGRDDAFYKLKAGDQIDILVSNDDPAKIIEG